MGAAVWLEEFVLWQGHHPSLSFHLREMTCAGFSMLFFLHFLHLTTPVCKVRFCVGFQESSLIPKIVFSVLNQILSQRLGDSTDDFGSVKSVHRDLNLISCGF